MIPTGGMLRLVTIICCLAWSPPGAQTVRPVGTYKGTMEKPIQIKLGTYPNKKGKSGNNIKGMLFKPRGDQKT